MICNIANKLPLITRIVCLHSFEITMPPKGNMESARSSPTPSLPRSGLGDLNTSCVSGGAYADAARCVHASCVRGNSGRRARAHPTSTSLPTKAIQPASCPARCAAVAVARPLDGARSPNKEVSSERLNRRTILLS